MISIADAKNRLPALIHQAEAGEPVTITRRGKPVAVVLAVQEYERMRIATTARPSFWDVVQEVRAKLAAEDAFPDWTDEEIDSWRDRTIYEPRCDFSGPEYDWAGGVADDAEGPDVKQERA
jgi:prevent-host-death family protein